MINLRHRFASSPRRLLETALLVVALIIGVAVVGTSIGAAHEVSSVRRLGQTYAQLTGVQPSASSPLAAQREAMLKRITSSRLVAPPPMQLTGVLGDAAIFNGGMMVKAGQPAGDMTVKSVGANWVVVEKDGKEQKMFVFQSMPSAPPGRPGRGGPGGGGGARPAPGAPANAKPQAPAPDAPASGARRTGPPGATTAPSPAPAGAIELPPGSTIQLQGNGSIITVTPGNHP